MLQGLPETVQGSPEYRVGELVAMGSRAVEGATLTGWVLVRWWQIIVICALVPCKFWLLGTIWIAEELPDK